MSGGKDVRQLVELERLRRGIEVCAAIEVRAAHGNHVQRRGPQGAHLKDAKTLLEELST
jgi:hypothetical protein